MNNHRKGINNRFNLQICYDPKFRTFTYLVSISKTTARLSFLKGIVEAESSIRLW